MSTKSDSGTPERWWDAFQRWTREGSLEQDLRRFFEGIAGGLLFHNPLHWTPPLDVLEDPARTVIHMDLPGVKKKDVFVEMEKDILVISASRVCPYGCPRHCERGFGTFVRRVQVEGPVNWREARARLEEGVLSVSLPRPVHRVSTLPVEHHCFEAFSAFSQMHFLWPSYTALTEELHADVNCNISSKSSSNQT